MTLTEPEVLEKLAITSFHEMSKEKLPVFADMMDHMDPDVMKKAIEQFPEFSKMTSSTFADYKSAFEKALADNKDSNKQCFEEYSKIIDSLNSCLLEKEISFEEKKYYLEQIKIFTQAVDKKDSENKKFLLYALAVLASVLSIGVGMGIRMLGGGSKTS